MNLKMSSGKWRPFCLDFIVLKLLNANHAFPHAIIFVLHIPVLCVFLITLTLLSGIIYTTANCKIWVQDEFVVLCAHFETGSTTEMNVLDKQISRDLSLRRISVGYCLLQ